MAVMCPHQSTHGNRYPKRNEKRQTLVLTFRLLHLGICLTVRHYSLLSQMCKENLCTASKSPG